VFSVPFLYEKWFKEKNNMDVLEQEFAVLPLRDVVVYPHMVIPLFVGRDRSILALEAAMADQKKILLVAQQSATEDEPKAEDLFLAGTVATILQLLKLPDGTVKVLVEGSSERRLISFMSSRGTCVHMLWCTTSGMKTVMSWRCSLVPFRGNLSTTSR